MKNFLIITLTLLFTAGAWADGADYGLVAGFRSQSGDVTNSTVVSTSSSTGFQVGVTGSFNLTGALFFRSGLMYVERPIKLSLIGGTDSADVKTTYFDIPLTLSYKFADYAAVYAGGIIAVNLSKSYSGTGVFSGGTVTDIKSPIVPLVLGAAFRFAPQIGADVFFESFSGDVAQGFKNYKAVGANFIYYFD